MAFYEDGFLQPLAWNFMLYVLQFSKLMMCNSVGMWGLFWYNDNGEMTEACFNTGFVGAKVDYIMA